MAEVRRVAKIIHAHDALAELVKMEDASVDAVITDPPYSSGGAFRGDRMLQPAVKYVRSDTMTVRPDFSGDNRDQRAYAYWCVLWLSECLRIAKPSAPIVVFSDWRQIGATIDAIQAGGWVWRGILPWDKGDGARPMMGGFRAQCEYMVWGTRGPLDPRIDVGCLQGIFRHTVKQDDKHHIAGKPTALMRDVVRICPPGGGNSRPVRRQLHHDCCGEDRRPRRNRDRARAGECENRSTSACGDPRRIAPRDRTIKSVRSRCL